MKVDEEITGIDPEILSKLSHVSNFVLSRLDDFQELRCKHGPGAVFEGYKANQKWSALLPYLSDLDSRLESVGYDIVYGLYHDRLPESRFEDSPTSQVARLVTVPKTCSSLRTITVEPLLNQFVQQGLNDHLRKEIDRCPVMSCCLALSTQEPNQILALEGSRTGEWVTVDLSSASDRLSTQLVESCFAHRPRFLSAILGCRTPFVEVDGRSIQLKKYAGMGNATTFPIQSYVFALIAITSMIENDESLSFRKLAAYASNVRVFGDDIVIRTEHFPTFAKWISSCGLVINKDKTFSKGNFRESCGIDAYDGTSVTPVYLRQDPQSISTDASSFVGILSTCNQLWLQGMYSTSDCLKRMLDSCKKLPLIPKDSQGLGYHTHQDLSIRQRWSDTLHRFEVKTYVPVPVREKDEIDGYAALMKFFHSPNSGEFDRNHLSTSVRRFSISLRKRWVPVP